MHERTGRHIEDIVAASATETNRAIRTNPKLGDGAIAPGIGAGWHAERRTHDRVGEAPDAHQLLANDARLPLQLRRIGEVLPLEAAGFAKLRVARGDAIWRRTQHLHQRGAGIVAAFTG